MFRFRSDRQGSLERIRRAAELSPGAIQVSLPDWVPLDIASAKKFLDGCRKAADPIGLVLYNPPHTKTVLTPDELLELARWDVGLVGIKFGGGSEAWYKAMSPVFERLSVFVPGYNFASGVAQGAHGSYSNMACLNPHAAVRWGKLTIIDPQAALNLKKRVLTFMREALEPLLGAGHPGFACDKLMAAAGPWTEITPRLLWPHGASIRRNANALPCAVISRIYSVRSRFGSRFGPRRL